MITEDELLNWFSVHETSTDNSQGYAELRTAGLALASVIKLKTPPCADQAVAIRKVREAVMTACAAIACKGR